MGSHLYTDQNGEPLNVIATKQILELVSDSISIPWDDSFNLCKDSFQRISFKEGDEIALFADIETFENQELPLLIYNPAYNKKYSVFYIFFGHFSPGFHKPSLLNTNKSPTTLEISENNISGELIEWCEEGYNSYFTFLDHKLDGYCEYKLMQTNFPDRGFCKDGKKEGLWESDSECFLEDDLDFFPLQIDVYKNDLVTKTIFIESKQDYETYLPKSNLPRIRQKEYGFYNMSALDWDNLQEKYKLIQEDVYFKSINL